MCLTRYLFFGGRGTYIITIFYNYQTIFMNCYLRLLFWLPILPLLLWSVEIPKDEQNDSLKTFDRMAKTAEEYKIGRVKKIWRVGGKYGGFGMEDFSYSDGLGDKWIEYRDKFGPLIFTWGLIFEFRKHHLEIPLVYSHIEGATAHYFLKRKTADPNLYDWQDIGYTSHMVIGITYLYNILPLVIKTWPMRDYISLKIGSGVGYFVREMNVRIIYNTKSRYEFNSGASIKTIPETGIYWLQFLASFEGGFRNIFFFYEIGVFYGKDPDKKDYPWYIRTGPLIKM